MKSNLNCILLLFALVYSMHVSAFENDLTTICRRPGTNLLYVGGEFNSILVVDKETGSTTNQIDIETKVLSMQFNSDGSKLVIFDGKNVRFLDPENGEESYSLKATSVQFFEGSPYFVDSDWIFSNSVKVYSIEDGSPVYSYKPEFKVLLAGIDASSNELIVLGRSMEIKGEKGLIQKKIESSDAYNIYTKAYTKQQQDKQGSGFVVIDLESKKELINVEIPYYTSASYDLSISKYDNHYYIACWDMLIEMDEKGLAYPITCDDPTFAYATSASLDGETIFISSSKNGQFYNCKTATFFGFDVREEAEFSYSVDILFNRDTVYLLADDFTITVMNKKAMVLKRIRIDNSTGEGYGLHYMNGYRTKEDRDKEAQIINEALEEAGMESISLEENIGSDMIIGVFETFEKAEEFQKKIDGNGLQYLTKIAPYSSEE